jgi:anthranilate/para-aminobenzoate synthase component II
MKVLVIGGWTNELHRMEFAEPVAMLAPLSKVMHYTKMSDAALNWADRIVICGESLQDKGYPAEQFIWIKRHEKPVLGICAGLQVIGRVFGVELRRGVEIGLRNVEFKRAFLGLAGKHQVYNMHTRVLESSESLRKNFEIYCNNRFPQAIKHKSLPIYGVMFHPEARTKQLIVNFISDDNI